MGEKKYFCEYDDNVTVSMLAGRILNDPDLPQITSIIVGMWDEEMWDQDPSVILQMIIDNKEKFQHVQSLFIGDVDSDELEISWIKQGNYEELLRALPNLKSLKIQGSEDLVLGSIDHENLTELEICCGGLPVSVVGDLKNARLPSLESLVLYLGVESYGGDCSASDLKGLAKKDLFPNLKTLGFLDSEQQDDMVRVILESDILPQLETIDVSCGCLTNRGGQLILDAVDRLGNLKKLDMHYHYMSSRMVDKLKALPFEVDVSDEQEADDYGMWPMITE